MVNHGEIANTTVMGLKIIKQKDKWHAVSTPGVYPKDTVNAAHS